MTDLVRYDPARDTIALAPEAWTLAQRIARTEFVPKGLRDKPEAVLAAILTGHEAGIGPMQSLSKIHVVEGRPGMAAELMRALVLRDGHDVWIEEQTNTKCTVVGTRKGSTRETRMTWTIDDAKNAGLSGKDNWRKYPRAMLLARATADLMRAVFPDVIAGISYSLEELTDGVEADAADVAGGDDTSPPASTGRKARARRPATTAAAPAAAPSAPPPAPEQPPLPGEEDDVDDAEVVEDAYEGPDEDRNAGAVPLANRIAMWCKEAGLETDDERHRFLEAASDGVYSSSKDVPAADVEFLRAALVKVYRGELRLGDRDGRPVLVKVAPETADSSARSAPDDSGTSPEGLLIPPSGASGDHSATTSSPEATNTADGHTEALPGLLDEAGWRELMRAKGVRVSDLVKIVAQCAPDIPAQQLPGNVAGLVAMPELAERVRTRIEGLS